MKFVPLARTTSELNALVRHDCLWHTRMKRLDSIAGFMSIFFMFAFLASFVFHDMGNPGIWLIITLVFVAWGIAMDHWEDVEGKHCIQNDVQLHLQNIREYHS